MSWKHLHGPGREQFPDALGQAVSALSLSVVIASDYILPVSFSNDENYGVVGASTLRTASQIGNATGAAAFGVGLSNAQTLRVVLPTDQSALGVTQSGTWTIVGISGTISLPTGAATAANQTTGADCTKSTLITNDYTGTSVTTAAYVTLNAATTNAINHLSAFDSSGSIIILATGAAGLEVPFAYVPPGGFGTPLFVNIPAGTRIAAKALDTNATTGRLAITGTN